MSKNKLRQLLVLVGTGLACVTTWAGTASYDFNAAPPPDLQFVLTSPDAGWRSTGGVNNSGYVALFDSVNSQYGAVMIPDFDSGLIVKSFSFEVELRVGNAVGNDGRPADGFSINYCRSSDPVVADLSQEPPVANWNSYAIPSAPEGGTTTGLSICFDTWSGNTWPSGETDIEGIILRVDNVTKARVPMATRNGSCTDATSLQTGPYNPDLNGAPDELCWAPLKVELAENGEVTVTWKGTVIVDKVQTGFSPSAGRIVMAGRTGGANENTHVDNLKITTVAADKMLIGTIAPNPFGFRFDISDSGQSVLNPATLVVKYDGNNVTPTSVTKVGSVTTVVYTDMATRLAAGSEHTVEVTAQDAQAATVTRTQTYTIPAYILVPPEWKVTGTPTTPGMKTRTHIIDESAVAGFTGRYGDVVGNENRISSAEMQLANGYIDSDTRQPYPNSASPDTSDITLVNWDQAGGDPGGDNFNSTLPAAGPVPNDAIPGVDPFGAVNDNVVAEAVCYVQLARGLHRWGVNSDDGFRVSVAPGQPSITGLVLGEFNDGRGASDTQFEFVVDEDGYYPVRLIWFEGNGGANCEWFSVDLVTGEKKLINGTAANAVKAFRAGAGRAVVKSVMPSNGWLGGRKAPGIKAELIDGSTTVVDGSVKLIVNGVDVSAQATIVNGATTTVTFNPAAAFDWGQTPNWQLKWQESTTPPTDWTHDFTFRLAPDDLPATGAFWIEVEDWDHGNGQTVAAASTMPYVGGAYTGLAGVIGVDWFDDQAETDAGINRGYRFGDPLPTPHVDLTDNLGGRFGADRPGTTDMTVSYRIGWVGNFWGNYTRTIPAGVYKAYAALSIDNSNANGTYADLDRVAAGVGTQNQTLDRIGTFYGRGNGTWGGSELAPLMDSSGREAVLNVESGNTTLRVTARSGDIDWFVLIPSPGAPARLRSGPPTGTAPFSIPQTLRWVLDDFGTTINTASASLKIDGVAVPAASFPVVKNGKVTTATYVADIGKVHTYEFSINDSAGATIATSGTFIANFMTPSPSGMFLVEGEDFNTGGGQVQAAVNTMPYLGNAYNGLSATHNVDYFREDVTPDGNIYRLNEAPNVPMSNDGDTARARDAAGVATWVLTANYRLGWAGGGRWMDYTRQIPLANYQVWASLSYGDTTDADIQLIGNLSKVTSDPTQPNQTVETVGYFRGPATGGWGANQLVPLRSTESSTGNAAVVSLGGTSPTTLRYEYASGDFDYLMLVPAGAAPPQFTKIELIPGTPLKIRLEWTGGGVPEVADNILGPWVAPDPNATSPVEVPVDPAKTAQFARIRL